MGHRLVNVRPCDCSASRRMARVASPVPHRGARPILVSVEEPTTVGRQPAARMHGSDGDATGSGCPNHQREEFQVVILRVSVCQLRERPFGMSFESNKLQISQHVMRQSLIVFVRGSTLG